MFAYPKQSEFNRVVPKAKIYAHAQPTRRIKELFVARVGEIVWKYKLSSETTNLPARDGIREIQVFEIRLKTPELDDAVLAAIDRAIPFPLVFRLRHEDQLRSVVSYKRPSEADSNQWVVEGRFASAWYATGGTEGLQPLPVALDLAGLYEQIIRHHLPIAARPGESLAAQVDRVAAVQARQRRLRQLESGLAREKQFNRKVELNAALRALSQELAVLSEA